MIEEDPRKALADDSFAEIMLKTRRFLSRAVITSSDGEPYIERIRLKKFSDGSTQVIHIFYQSDNDRWPHDHPWDFESTILYGSYVEHVPGKAPRIFMPGDVNKKRAEEPHKLELVNGPVVTMALRGPTRRKWCFHTDTGLVESLEWLKSQGITPHD